MFCSPSNPTGRIIPAAELEKIAEVVKKHKIWCLSDEIYCELLYDNHKHVSIGQYPGMKDYAIIFNGFSKSFAMTGWRIGYIAATHDLLSLCCKLQSALYAKVPEEQAAGFFSQVYMPLVGT